MQLGIQNFKQPNGPFLLWADALCIDQSNASEKNTQIPMMGRVYESAIFVIAPSSLGGREMTLIIETVSEIQPYLLESPRRQRFDLD
jgi:hypothetical protein